MNNRHCHLDPLCHSDILVAAGYGIIEWLRLFRSSADSLFRGPGCEKAKRIAANVAANMQRRLGEEAGQPGE